jgi:hypothetical protein
MCRLHSPTGLMVHGAISWNSGFYTGMGPNKILAPLQDLVPTLSGAYSCHYSLACVWVLHFKLVKFVYSHLESIKLQMPLMEMKTTYYLGPWTTPPLVSPDAAGPFIAPCQQEAITEQILLSLSLTAVRATIERGDWRMDCKRSQKVINGQGDTSPSQKTSVCIWETSLPSGNTQNGYIIQSPPQPTRPWVPLPSPLWSLSLLFCTNKIFPTSAAGVCLCFHSQSRLKNPEHLKFLCVSSVHQDQEWKGGNNTTYFTQFS